MYKHLQNRLPAALCAAAFVVLAGCVTHHDRPGPERVYVDPPSAYAERRALAQPDYVYYPGYQVYYSSPTRQYMYLDGRSWVTRPAPPRVSVDVLLASPSVRLDFHDSPAKHHAAVVRKYPTHWAPSESSSSYEKGSRNDANAADRGAHR